MDLRKGAQPDPTRPESARPEPTRPQPPRPEPSLPAPSPPGGSSLLGPGGAGGVPAGRRASTSASAPGLVSLNLRYYALRAALFGGFGTLMLVLGVDGLLAFALAVVASGLVSFPLAMRQRRASVAATEARRGVRR